MPLDPRIEERLGRIDTVAPDGEADDIVLNGIGLHVDPGVFNPAKGKSGRKILRAIDLIPPSPDARIVEIGTGCGHLSAAMWLRGCRNIVASDIMVEACNNARRNFDRLGFEISVVHSDLLASIQGDFDYIVFNAPAAHPKRFSPNRGATTLYDVTGTTKQRFVEQLLQRKPSGRLRAMFTYSSYIDYAPITEIGFGDFEVNYLLVDKDEISETGIVLLSRD
ncbi:MULTISPECIES: methyltransferase [Mesorhizobium]|uniref:Methyltransferase small domain-containing protein n=1 Tax=Mesorhizobium robiniae TaxID=559315 RepID=A0ABV2GZA4_9HYPH|nr:MULTISPECIES: methyltransferase [Mesorhizobium]MCV3211837.1 methyltransferase [Mesorhizobium sp. YC-2]MCV3233567.1 methyltransferase [Mesorhizobium sp. YC-39]MCV3244076.1 methyltransferase [Mesorhizobium sp. ZC-5]